MRVKNKTLRRLHTIAATNSNQALSSIEDSLREDGVTWKDITEVTDFLANFSFSNMPAMGRHLKALGFESPADFAQMAVFYTLSRVLERRFGAELYARDQTP